MCKLYLSCCGLHCLCKFPVHSGFIIFVSNLGFLTFSNVSECLFQVTHIVVNICTVLFVYSTCTSILSLHVSSCFVICSKAFCMLSKRLYVCAQRFLYMFLICFRNIFICFPVRFVWVPTFDYVFQSFMGELLTCLLTFFLVSSCVLILLMGRICVPNVCVYVPKCSYVHSPCVFPCVFLIAL
jgi:hypothetical protein